MKQKLLKNLPGIVMMAAVMVLIPALCYGVDFTRPNEQLGNVAAVFMGLIAIGLLFENMIRSSDE